MNETTLTLLGDFHLSVDGGPITLPTRKAEALLAYLALQPGQHHGRDNLAALLWGRQTDEQARRNLRNCLASLRKALGPAAAAVIDADKASIMLRADAIEVDVATLRQVTNGDRTVPPADAIRLCNGELLAKLSLREAGWEDWLSLEREAARKLQAEVLRHVTESRLEQGDGEAAVASAEKLAHLDPLDESSQRLLMRTYTAAGRRSAALTHYQTAKALLASELGVEPETETTALLEAIKTAKDGKQPAGEAASELAPKGPGAAPAAPDRLAIAVLPFANISGDPEQEYFADGIVEDLTTALSRFRWFLVVARNTTFTYKGRAVDVTEVGRDLNARYVVEGSVRKGGDQVRITVQLIDAQSGNHIWAEHYDRPLDAIFAVQDEIIEAIVAAIEPELGSTERERAKRKPPDGLDAWESYHRGLWHLYQFSKDGNARAQQLMRRAIAMDPGFALAYAGLADALYMEIIHGHSERPDWSLREAFEAAQQTVALDDRHAGAHFSLGRVYYLKRDHEAAIAAHETAIGMNPSFADAYYGLSMALLYAGRPEEAVDAIDHALRLSPHDPYHWIFHVIRSVALTGSKRYEQALASANEAARHPGAKVTAFLVQAQCLAQLGRLREARAALAKARQVKPDVSLGYVRRIMPFKNPSDFEIYTQALRDLGLGEGSDDVRQAAAADSGQA